MKDSRDDAFILVRIPQRVYRLLQRLADLDNVDTAVVARRMIDDAAESGMYREERTA